MKVRIRNSRENISERVHIISCLSYYNNLSTFFTGICTTFLINLFFNTILSSGKNLELSGNEFTGNFWRLDGSTLPQRGSNYTALRYLSWYTQPYHSYSALVMVQVHCTTEIDIQGSIYRFIVRLTGHKCSLLDARLPGKHNATILTLA